MGYMIEVGILADDWSRIKKDPKRLIDQIDVEMNWHNDPNGFSNVTVLPMHHAHDLKVIAAFQNDFCDFSIPTSYSAILGEKYTAERRKFLLEYQLQLMEQVKRHLKYSEDSMKMELDKVNTLISNGVE